MRAARWCAALAASILLLGGGTAAAEPAAPPSTQADPVRVMPLGDSITDGLTVPGGYRIDLWQKLVASGHSIDFVGSLSNGPASLGDHDHEGHSGWTIAQIDANIVNWLRTYTPRTILLHIGTNDMYGGDPAGAPARLSTLVDHITAQAPNADLFVATIIPLASGDQTVRTFNATIPGMVQSKVNAGKHVHLVDMYSALTTADLADGVHPNAGGYSKMATRWFAALQSVPGSIGDPSQPPPTGGDACTATPSVVGSWNGGFQAKVTVRNTGSATLNGWTVGVTLPGGQTITNMWDAVAAGAGTVRNAPYNGSIAPGATTTFGFLASGNGSAQVATPTCGAAASPLAAQDVASPPMGWASWNTFAAQINYDVIKAQTDALVSSGLKDAGYQYVNIDEGWWQGTRDGAGNITVDTREWPGGMKAIADYIHSKGLKAGIYTDAGRDGCGYYFPTGRPAAPGSGSEGHYDQDFLQFSQWGFDFVKVDWCGGDAEGLDARGAYQSISNAISRATAQTGRPMVLSVCNWGKQSPWNWAPGMSTMWRTSADIIYFGESPSMDRVLGNFDAAQHPTAQSAGHYNDPDMLIAGMPGFTAAQNRTHLSLWAVSGAPLLAGNKLSTMNTETRDILANREVIAIDQDSLGRQGVKVAEDQSGRQLYSKVLSGTGRRAVVLLNRTTSASNITVRFADLGLGATASVRNVWTATDLGSKTTSYTVNVPAREAVLLTVTGADSSGGSKTGALVGQQSNRCLDINNFATANGTQAQLWDCNGQDNQRWTYTAGRQLTIYNGTKCLDANNQGTTNGTQAVIWDCNGQPNQQWTLNTDGTVRGVQSGLCLDATNAATTNGTKIVLWTCGTASNQKWTMQ